MLAVEKSPWAARAEKLLVELGRNKSWLARQLGVSKQKVYNWFEGQQPREPGTWERIVAFLDAQLAATSEPVLSSPKIPVGFPMVMMHYAGEVPAGNWGDPLASEEFVEMDVRFEHPKRFVARVVGESCWPALRQGDLTVWHSDLSPQYGLIVLAQRDSDHACTVKQLLWDEAKSRPVLSPVNPDYDVQDSGHGWRAIARLVAVVRRTDGLETSWFLPEGLRVRHLRG